MNANLLNAGNSYLVKVGKNEVKVCLVRANPDGGWIVSSLAGGNNFLVKDPGRFLRCIETSLVVAQSPLVAPVPAQTPTTPQAAAQIPAPVPVLQIAVSALAATKKLSMLDAAVEVLKNSQVPMSCKDIIAAMESSGLWSPGKGLTPVNTLTAAIGVEIRQKSASRFRKTAPGLFEFAGGQNSASSE